MLLYTRGMATIQQFNRQNIQAIRPDLQLALDKIAEKYGIAIKVGNASYYPETATYKIELSTKSSDGTIVTKERNDFTLFALRFGLKPEWLDRTFTYSGDTYKIVGLKTKARTAPVLAANSSGKVYKFNAEFVRSQLAPTPFDVSLNKAREANLVANKAIVIGPRNPDHDEIERRLNDLRNNNPEAYYADGERRGSQKQIHDEIYRSIAREIADERSGRKPLFGSTPVPPPPPVK
jgi:hypothetical protein